MLRHHRVIVNGRLRRQPIFGVNKARARKNEASPNGCIDNVPGEFFGIGAFFS